LQFIEKKIGWADARIGQSLEINISLTIAKS